MEKEKKSRAVGSWGPVVCRVCWLIDGCVV